MNKIEEVYCTLTGVHLDEQRKIWDERGKGYYGEFLVFQELFQNVRGRSKLLMNLNIPTGDGSTTEIDLLMIHESGIYVFEIKHYKGTIYGKPTDKTWTQYFRTAPNHVFKNPLLQNEYHIKAVQRMFPGIPVYSVVVFTNNDCNLCIESVNTVWTLADLKIKINQIFENNKPVLNMNEIDVLFHALKSYSPIREKMILADDGKALPFYEYIEAIQHYYKQLVNKTHTDCNNFLKNVEVQQCNFLKQLEVYKSSYKKRCITAFAVILLLCIFLFCSICNSYEKTCDEKIKKAEFEVNVMELQVQEMNDALQEMENKYAEIDPTNSKNRQLSDRVIQVTAELEMHPDLVNTAVLSCTLTNTAKEYGILLNKNTMFIIIMNDGTVHEYVMFGDRLTYNKGGNMLYETNYPYGTHTATLKPLEIHNITDVAQIEYIKITNVSLWNLSKGSNYPLSDWHEIELYSQK